MLSVRQIFTLLQLFFLFITLLVFSSCDLMETDPVVIPAYIYVPATGFSTTVATEGDSSSKFPDVWIYSGGQVLGTIGLPALIPVQRKGPADVSFDAGILKTGQDLQRAVYPFTSREIFIRQLTPGKIDTFYPVFKYVPGTKFSVIEGFETQYRFGYNALNAPGDTIKGVHDTSYNHAIALGQRSGQVIMDPVFHTFEIDFPSTNITNGFVKETLQPFTGDPVYLEMDYKSDLPVNVGMYAVNPVSGTATVIPLFTSNPSPQWNKVYINLDQDISPTSKGTIFTIAISVLNPGLTAPNVFLDNIKLVHF